MEIGPGRFRALARSSPWRWSTLRYVQERNPSGSGDDPVRARVRRPGLARVERPDGTLLSLHRHQPRTVTSYRRGGEARPTALPDRSTVEVELDHDGLVRHRPRRSECDLDDPMIGSYYNVAILDPVELADAHDGGPGATIEELRSVDHQGRVAWEAVLRPTADYDPRCPCCPLLLSEAFERSGLTIREGDPSFVYPDAHRVRLDVGTGVCVAVEQLGGTRAGWGHDLAIEAVDEPMGDELFPGPWRRRWMRLLRRS